MTQLQGRHSDIRAVGRTQCHAVLALLVLLVLGSACPYPCGDDPGQGTQGARQSRHADDASNHRVPAAIRTHAALLNAVKPKITNDPYAIVGAVVALWPSSRPAVIS